MTWWLASWGQVTGTTAQPVAHLCFSNADCLSHADLKGLKACRQLDLSTYHFDPPVMWPAKKCVLLLTCTLSGH